MCPKQDSLRIRLTVYLGLTPRNTVKDTANVTVFRRIVLDYSGLAAYITNCFYCRIKHSWMSTEC
jgi:hypothetical protein